MSKNIVLMSLLFVSGCQTAQNLTAEKSVVCSGQTMIASHYGSGRRTASGERFVASGFTAAHRRLPFGTQLNVMNPKTGATVVVRINDRGPFVRGRSLDISTGAARQIGFSGVGRVCVT